jgi:glucose/arabinose dehydrogenase
LYVGTTADSSRNADDLGSYAGKILRFTTAGDALAGGPIGSSPVISFGHRGPRLDFDWDPATGSMWSVETSAGGVSLGRTLAGSPGAEPAFLEGIQAVGAAFHFGAAPATWRDSLFLASPEDECLYRVSGLASTPPTPLVEQFFAGRFGRITAVLSAPDGLYFAAGNGGTDDRGRPTDAIFRIRDAGARPDSAALRLTPSTR